MAYTITHMSTEIGAVHLRRTDLTEQLDVYGREVYRIISGKVPFEELMATDTVTLTIGVNVVDLATTTADLSGIKNIRINYLDGTGLRLRKDHINNFDKVPLPPNGRPIRYARFGKT